MSDSLPARAARPRTGFLSRFLGDRAGNVAMIFGLAAIPFFTAAGAAVDYSRALHVKGRLANALDATALAIGGQLGLTDAEIQKAAQSYFTANFPANEIGNPGPLQIASTNSTVTISTDATVQTAMMGIVGINTIDVEVEVEVRRSMRGLELALVLDTTGSMADDGKMTALKQAGADLINILCGQTSCPDTVKIGVVPFAAAVKLDPQTAIDGGWIDTSGTHRNATANFASRFAYQIYRPLTGNRQSYQMNRKWSGCVEARMNMKSNQGSGKPAFDLEITDDVPSSATGKENTRWVPFFAPDEPDNDDRFSNRYVTDGSNSTWDVRLKRIQKYVNIDNAGVDAQCGMQPILDLTSNRGDIIARINALNSSGHTHIPIGLGWGWRLLSPGAPYSRGVDYTNALTDKALILMSDGMNTIPTNNSPAGSAYTAYGYLFQARLGSSDAGDAVDAMNDQTEAQCDAIKAKGIELYTILLMEDDDTVHDLLEDCATEPGMFFDTPSAAELRTVFRAIGAELSNLRVSR